MCGPVDATELMRQSREELDLRGVQLASVSHSGLPLTSVGGGLTQDEADIYERDLSHTSAALLIGAKPRLRLFSSDRFAYT